MRKTPVTLSMLFAVTVGATSLVSASPAAAATPPAALAPTSAQAASAASAASSASSAAAAPGWISVRYPIRARAGRVVTYKITLTNRQSRTSQKIFFAAKFPKNVYKVRIYVPKGSRYREGCTRERTRSLCLFPGLKKGKSYTLWAKAWVNGSARGTLYGYFGGSFIPNHVKDPRYVMRKAGDEIRWIKTRTKLVR